MNRTTYIQQTAAIQRRYENKYYKLVQTGIRNEIDHIAGIVKYHGVEAARRYTMQQLHSKGLPAIIQSLYLEVGLQFARKTWRVLQEQRRALKPAKSVGLSIEFKAGGFGFNSAWVQFIKDFLYLFLIEKITFEVAITTRDVIMNVLNDSIANGWGVDETVRHLDELPLDKTQAARIVRTEITRASNTGVFAAGSTYEFEQTKEWISAHDNRTRGSHAKDHASHVDLDGITINYEDHFTDPRNGDQLMFPGDPAASAASTINCRCVIALQTKVGADGRPIRKNSVFANIRVVQ